MEDRVRLDLFVPQGPARIELSASGGFVVKHSGMTMPVCHEIAGEIAHPMTAVPVKPGIAPLRGSPRVAICCLARALLSAASRSPGPCSASRPAWLPAVKRTSPLGQLSPGKSMSFPRTTAAITLSAAPAGLRHFVLTRPASCPCRRLMVILVTCDKSGPPAGNFHAMSSCQYGRAPVPPGAAQ
jgi:hypothetical protein